MRAAGLKAIATVLESQAVLIRSAHPHSQNLALIELITSRIAGVIAASKYVMCNYNIERSNLHQATQVTPGRRAATISPLEDPEWVAVSSMILKKRTANIMDQLQALGAQDILIFNIVSLLDFLRKREMILDHD
jgi:ATP phosphoribosyltransferase